ncbi:MAG: calmodulin-binding protein [Thermoguttaceae bacterium]
MFRSCFFVMCCIAAFAFLAAPSETSAQQGYGQQWAGAANAPDWQRFYYYPYVYYPQNFYTPEYFQSSQDMYNRYPAEMQVPAYNKDWMNYYPSTRKYHSGAHFKLDIF